MVGGKMKGSMGEGVRRVGVERVDWGGGLRLVIPYPTLPYPNPNLGTVSPIHEPTLRALYSVRAAFSRALYALDSLGLKSRYLIVVVLGGSCRSALPVS